MVLFGYIKMSEMCSTVSRYFIETFSFHRCREIVIKGGQKSFYRIYRLIKYISYINHRYGTVLLVPVVAIINTEWPQFMDPRVTQEKHASNEGL